MIFPTYRSKPVMDARADFENSQPQLGQLDDHTFDNRTPWKVTSLPRRQLSFGLLFNGVAEAKQFRVFVADRDGCRKGFWVPTWSTDHEIVSDAIAGTTTLTVKWTGLTEKVSFGAQFRHLALITPTTMQFYRVNSAVTSGDNEVLTLDRGLDTDVIANSLTVCCGLLFARFADNEFPYQYISGGAVALQAKFVELPTETEGTVNNGAQPAKLFLITRGASTWRFTDWPVDLSCDGHTWTAADIDLGEIKSSLDFVADGVSLTVTTDDPNHPFRYFVTGEGSEATYVTVYGIEVGDASPGDPIYVSRIATPKPGKRGRITANLSSLLRIGEQQSPRRRVMRHCGNELFDAYCGISEATYTTAGTLTAVSLDPAYIEATAFGAKATAESDPNWFALGRVTVGGETRFCVGAAGNRLYLNAAFSGAVVVGSTANARAGCDKQGATCDSAKFNNIENFQGFEYLPKKDPQYEALEIPKASGGKKS
jgi:uncharacterized phage protein (TIGR02218 family)